MMSLNFRMTKPKLSTKESRSKRSKREETVVRMLEMGTLKGLEVEGVIGVVDEVEVIVEEESPAITLETPFQMASSITTWILMSPILRLQDPQTCTR